MLVPSSSDGSVFIISIIDVNGECKLWEQTEDTETGKHNSGGETFQLTRMRGHRTGCGGGGGKGLKTANTI